MCILLCSFISRGFFFRSFLGFIYFVKKVSIGWDMYYERKCFSLKTIKTQRAYLNSNQISYISYHIIFYPLSLSDNSTPVPN